MESITISNKELLMDSLNSLSNEEIDNVLKLLPHIKNLDDSTLNTSIEYAKIFKNLDLFDDSIYTLEMSDGSKTVVSMPDDKNNRSFVLTDTSNYLKARLECQELFKEHIHTHRTAHIECLTDILPHSKDVYTVQVFSEGYLENESLTHPSFSGDKFIVLCIEPTNVRFSFTSGIVENVGIPRTLFFIRLTKLSARVNKNSIILQDGDPYEIRSGYVVCVKDSMITDKTLVYQAPYSNLVNSLGSICWGSNYGREVSRFKDFPNLYSLPYRFFGDMISSHGGSLNYTKAKSLEDKEFDTNELKPLTFNNAKHLTYGQWIEQIFNTIYKKANN